jgi:SWI/SNF-related matrix-associated actin-dependent regulator of chromatin subfamily A3
VKLCGDMTELDRNLRSSHEGPIQGHVMLALRQVETRYLVMFSNGDIYGEINAQLHEALTTLSQQAYHLDFEVFAPIDFTREIIGKSIKDKTAIVRVQINIYGAHISAKHIGHELSQHRLYLQRPDYLRSDAGYDNPHVLKLADFISDEPLTKLAEAGDEPEKAAVSELGLVITDVYSSLTRSQKLTRLKGDDRLITQLLP